MIYDLSWKLVQSKKTGLYLRVKNIKFEFVAYFFKKKLF